MPFPLIAIACCRRFRLQGPMRRGIGYQSLLDEMMSRCVCVFFFLITRFYGVSRLRSVGKTGNSGKRPLNKVHATIILLIRTITKFSNVIGYQLP